MNTQIGKKPELAPKVTGHKCLGARLAVEVNCECGWVSCPHSGDRARAHAYSEWRDHVRSKHKGAN